MCHSWLPYCIRNYMVAWMLGLRGTHPCQLSDCWEEERRLCIIANCGCAWVFPPESNHWDRKVISGFAMRADKCYVAQRRACRWIWHQATWLMMMSAIKNNDSKKDWMFTVKSCLEAWGGKMFFATNSFLPLTHFTYRIQNFLWTRFYCHRVCGKYYLTLSVRI